MDTRVSVVLHGAWDRECNFSPIVPRVRGGLWAAELFLFLVRFVEFVRKRWRLINLATTRSGNVIMLDHWSGVYFVCIDKGVHFVFLALSEYAWAGGYPDNGVWRWIGTNAAVDDGPTYWDSGEPHSYVKDYMCLGYSGDRGLWHDCCDCGLHSICEI